jgi:hypothetical protein
VRIEARCINFNENPPKASGERKSAKFRGKSAKISIWVSLILDFEEATSL